ncbi:sensor histidine kinase [Methylobacterium thuringiense]|uniref:sensor histidine kinase n=1 Tax=Methylobacterium thuringiense TaxID=1003091 RepID=UPI003570E2A4
MVRPPRWTGPASIPSSAPRHGRKPAERGCVLDNSGEDDRGADLRAPGLHEAVFAGASIGLALIAADGRTLRDVNPFLCRLLGYMPGSLAGAPVTNLLTDRTPVLAPGIRRWRRADGNGVDLRLTITPAPHDGRGDADLVAVVEPVDADELVRAEQNRDALVAAGLGEWRWEATSGQVSLSRRAGRILGYPAGRSARWSTMQTGFVSEDHERIHGIVAAALARREPWEFESRFTRGNDGMEVAVGVRGAPTYGADDTLTGMVGIVRNVTRRIEAQKLLREREQRLRVATSLASLGIFEWHLLDDAAVWENERMFEIFGRRAEEGGVGKGEFLNRFLHPEDRPHVRRAITKALREDGILKVSGRIRHFGTGAWRSIEMAGRFERDEPDRLPRRLIGVVADVTDRLQAQERQTLLIRELHHRVKNTLATVQAIVGSTARTASSIDNFYEAFVGRIKSLSHTHSVLTEDTWQTAKLHGLLVNELTPYIETEEDGSLESRVSLIGPVVDLPSDIAVPIGMAIHELTTNAAKYGALSTRQGRITVSWSIVPGGEAGILQFAWCESEGPPVSVPSRQGFGSRLLQRVLTTQVQAEVRSEYAPEGFRLSMLAPLPARNAALNPLV